MVTIEIPSWSAVQWIVIVAALGIITERLITNAHVATNERDVIRDHVLKIEAENDDKHQYIADHVWKLESTNKKLVEKVESNHRDFQKNQDEIITKLDAVTKKLETKMSGNTDLQELPVDGACPLGYVRNPHPSTCLRLIREEKSWKDAARHCTHDSQHLVIFTSMESAKWFINYRYDNTAWRDGYLWIGGKREDDDNWFWASKNWLLPINNDKIPWGDGEPDNGSEHCLFSQPQDGYKFHDLDCEKKAAFVCETGSLN